MTPHLHEDELLPAVVDFLKSKLKVIEGKSGYRITARLEGFEGSNINEKGVNEKIHIDAFRLLCDGGVSTIKSSQGENPSETMLFLNFFVPAENMVHADSEALKLIRSISLQLNNKYRYHDFIYAKAFAISPKYQLLHIHKNLTASTSKTIQDLKEIVEKDQYSRVQGLPMNVQNNAISMADIYMYLYCLENYLRIFITKIFREAYGDEYRQSIVFPQNMQRGVEARIQQENQNKWVSSRGNSFEYYLDFKDLGKLIHHNFALFKEHFPHENWISHKLNELAHIRNLVAHNSSIGDIERELIKLELNIILQQINH